MLNYSCRNLQWQLSSTGRAEVRISHPRDVYREEDPYQHQHPWVWIPRRAEPGVQEQHRGDAGLGSTMAKMHLQQNVPQK